MGWAFFLLISGAIIAHFAAISGQALLSLTWLLGLSLFGLRSLSWRARCLACLAIVGLVWVTGTAHAFYLPPILINVLLLVIFSMTLLPGRKPLIHSFAEHARGELEPRVADYTRRVTQAWGVVFCGYADRDDITGPVCADPSLVFVRQSIQLSFHRSVFSSGIRVSPLLFERYPASEFSRLSTVSKKHLFSHYRSTVAALCSISDAGTGRRREPTLGTTTGARHRLYPTAYPLDRYARGTLGRPFAALSHYFVFSAVGRSGTPRIPRLSWPRARR